MRNPRRRAQRRRRHVFAQERQQEIAQALRANGRVEVAALAAHYDVSEDTIRRDLRLLADHGLVQKTHGARSPCTQPSYLPLKRRRARHHQARHRTRRGLRTCNPTRRCSSTAARLRFALAQLLRAAGAPRPLTIVTTALDVASALLDDRQVKLVLAGGAWVPESRIFEGPQAVATAACAPGRYRFPGCLRLASPRGPYSQEAGDMALKRAMDRRRCATESCSPTPANSIP